MLVMNGDLLTRMSFADLIDFHQDMKAEASLCVREHTFQAPHGVAEVDGQRLISLREKPTFRWLANAGVYCLDPSVLQRVPAEGPYDMPELLAALAADGCVVGTYPIHEYWLDIGRPPPISKAPRPHSLRLFRDPAPRFTGDPFHAIAASQRRSGRPGTQDSRVSSS